MAINVVPLYESWNFNIGTDASTSTKVFIDADARPDLTPETLPNIGDTWDANWTLLLVESIEKTYVSDNDSCFAKYTVNYTQAQFEERNDLVPAALNMNAEFRTYTERNRFNNIAWKWPDGNVASDVEFSNKAFVVNFTMFRTLYTDEINAYMQILIARVGKINDAEFKTIPIGLVRLNGATLDEVIGANNSRKWKVQLRFTIKAIEWASDKGWNLEFNDEQKGWFRPTFNGLPLYDAVSFDELLTESDTPPGSYPDFPNR